MPKIKKAAYPNVSPNVSLLVREIRDSSIALGAAHANTIAVLIDVIAKKAACLWFSQNGDAVNLAHVTSITPYCGSEGNQTFVRCGDFVALALYRAETKLFIKAWKAWAAL